MALLFRASRIHPLRLVWVAALLIAMPQLPAAAQQTAPPAGPKPQDAPKQMDSPMQQTLQRRQGPASQAAADQGQTEPDRASAYYHYGLAHLYEEMAISAGTSGLRDAGGGGVQAGAGRRSKLGAAGGRTGRPLLQDRAHQGRGRRRAGPVEEEPGRCGGAHAAGAGVSAFAGRHAGHTGGRDAATGDRRVRDHRAPEAGRPGDQAAAGPALRAQPRLRQGGGGVQGRAEDRRRQRGSGSADGGAVQRGGGCAARGRYALGGAGGGPDGAHRVRSGGQLRPVEEAEGGCRGLPPLAGDRPGQSRCRARPGHGTADGRSVG